MATSALFQEQSSASKVVEDKPHCFLGAAPFEDQADYTTMPMKGKKAKVKLSQGKEPFAPIQTRSARIPVQAAQATGKSLAFPRGRAG
jgi:hypothetical protein